MDYETAKEKAVRYLVLALRTEEEVKNKLRKLNVEEGIIVQVTEYLKSIGYIDDEKYVEAYIRQCINIPKYSKYEIRMKLIQKGINKEILSEKLEELDNCDYENKLIDKLLKGKLKNMEPLKQNNLYYLINIHHNNPY